MQDQMPNGMFLGKEINIYKCHGYYSSLSESGNSFLLRIDHFRVIIILLWHAVMSELQAS